MTGSPTFSSIYRKRNSVLKKFGKYMVLLLGRTANMSKVSLQIVQSTERNFCKTLLNRLFSKKSIKDRRAEDGPPADLTYSKDQTLTSLEPSVSLKYYKRSLPQNVTISDVNCTENPTNRITSVTVGF